MKRRLMMALPLLLLGGIAGAAERTVVLDIANMYCAACPHIVRSALMRVDGVLDVSVSPDERTATVVYDDRHAQIEIFTAASANAGYPATERR
ncbi:mercuric transport protein periplasmic component [Nitratireductor sp. CAU 1489]|uniref:Mercuric transport protein periplasmic component n=1 Tax=Nitratireductor arenosus TaxID=2682096 RepID=A0A844QEN0_9HYPH|nr:cation transporter [Nitratireductor arenosus]MVA97782.1 mercuric transport protein periplasmic component [Nitratireductor arenosus]